MWKKYIITVIILLLMSISSVIFADDSSPANSNTTTAKTDEITQKYGFTLQEEREIGFQSAVLLAKRYGYYKNDKINNYVNRVGKSIVKQVSKRPQITYSFYVLDTPEINAFAVPGGFIFITKGALKVLANEAELAGVLAHEVAHVELGHGLQAINNNPALREKVRVLKVNLAEGHGFTQQSLREILVKDKNITSGIVNSGQLKDLKGIIMDKEGHIENNK